MTQGLVATAAVGLAAQLRRLDAVGGVAVGADDVQGFGHAGSRDIGPHPANQERNELTAITAQS
jgi:hypothetical protein